MIDEVADLFTSLRGIQCFSAALNRISNTVRFRAPTTLPKRMQRKSAAVSTTREHRFRHHREPAAHAGESTVLGKTAQFDGAIERTRDFENGMRNFRIRNVRFVRGIK